MDEKRKAKELMKTVNVNKCKQSTTWMHKAICGRFGLDAGWIQNHIANCPRCRSRLSAVGKVGLALSIIKSQPHKLDLLMHANTQAIGVLKHSIRQAPKARKLTVCLPEPNLLEKWSKYGHSAANVAACIAILLLMKIGVFSSMDKFQTEGKKAIEQYYAGHIGKDLVDEIFRNDTKQLT